MTGERDGEVLSTVPDKRERRTRARVEQLNEQIVQALEECHPNSVRHIFYLMTNPRLPEPVEKSERGARQVQDRLVKLRRAGRVPYGWVEDMSRRGYHVVTYDDDADFLERVAGLYRADLWRDADAYVEVWCESRSIAGVILPLCRELGVSLYPAGGNSSISFAYQAALNINECHGGRLVVVKYVGDWDDQGVTVDRALERELRRHLDPDVRLTLKRVAITPEQIRLYDLPTKPAKKRKDGRESRIKRTVEAEAMPPALLCELLRDEIESLLPPRALEVARVAERSERVLLEELAKALRREESEDE